MKILVTNDDGIDAPGLWALAAELAKVSEVVLFAPDREQSGTGTAITLRRSVTFAEVKSKLPRVKAYAVEGTPADSVLIGLEVARDVAAVFSGINRGANMGNDVLLSGTVGAALQGYFGGLPSVALSVVWSDEVCFEAGAKLAGLLARRILRGNSQSMLLNVNLPNLPLEVIQGVEVTRVGRGGYSSAIRMGRDGGKNNFRIQIGQPQWDPEEGTDIHAVVNGKVSITPLQGTLGTAEGIPFLDGSLPALLQELSP